MAQTSRNILFVVIAVLVVGVAASVLYYRGVVGNLEATNNSLESTSDVYNVDNLAYSHWSAITARNITGVMSQYASDSKLYWLGGSLNGNFTDSAGIQSEWTKFFGASSEVYMNVTNFKSRSSGANLVVTANLVFFLVHPETTTTKAPINYALVYASRDSKWVLVEEWWSIRPRANPYIT
jgi:hypothetical protein